jgi:hypothetical protein
MFDPKEESLALEIVRGFFDMPSEDMMKIGDKIKMLLFDPQIGGEQEAVAKLKEALVEMSKEQALIAGMFLSGLLRCNLAQQIEQQYQKAKAEGNIDPNCDCV